MLARVSLSPSLALVSAVAMTACGLVQATSAPDAGGADAPVRPPASDAGASGDGSTADAVVVGFLDAPLRRFDASDLSTCASCLALACDDLLVQCEQSSSCYSAYQCTLGSGSATSCACDAPGAIVSPFFALLRCVSTFACPPAPCAELCGASSGDDAGLSLPLACGDGDSFQCQGDGEASGPKAQSSTAACEACVASTCPELGAACTQESDCQAYLACLATCQGPTCIDDCTAAHPSGQGAADALDVCVGASCGAECEY